jgi:hypothetical protein
MYSFMVLLPRERLIGRSAPKGLDLVFVIEIDGNEFSEAVLKITAGRLQGRDRFVLFPKLFQITEKHFNIVDQSHFALVLVHEFKIRFRIAL